MNEQLEDPGILSTNWMTLYFLVEHFYPSYSPVLFLEITYALPKRIARNDVHGQCSIGSTQVEDLFRSRDLSNSINKLENLFHDEWL